MISTTPTCLDHVITILPTEVQKQITTTNHYALETSIPFLPRKQELRGVRTQMTRMSRKIETKEELNLIQYRFTGRRR